MKKFSIIDIFIVLAVVGAIVFVAGKIVTSGANKGERKVVSYTLMINAQEKGRYDNIKTGDIVCINESQDNDRAVVKKVEKTVAEVMTYNSNTGKYRMVENPEKEDIMIELESDVYVDKIGMKNGETSIKVGTNAVIRGTGYSGRGYIVKIDD